MSEPKPFSWRWRRKHRALRWNGDCHWCLDSGWVSKMDEWEPDVRGGVMAYPCQRCARGATEAERLWSERFAISTGSANAATIRIEGCTFAPRVTNP